MDFKERNVNRQAMPLKHILVADDDLQAQAEMAKHLFDMFGAQSPVRVSLVSGAAAAAGVLANDKVDLIILDHDMPNGNGADLIEWMNEEKFVTPIITFDDVDENNQKLKKLAEGKINILPVNKGAVIMGGVDNLIRQVLSGN